MKTYVVAIGVRDSVCVSADVDCASPSANQCIGTHVVSFDKSNISHFTLLLFLLYDTRAHAVSVVGAMAEPAVLRNTY